MKVVELRAGPLFTVVPIRREAFLELKDSLGWAREILATHFLAQPVMWQDFARDRRAFAIVRGPELRRERRELNLSSDEWVEYYDAGWLDWKGMSGDWSDESLHASLDDVATNLRAASTKLATALQQLACTWSAACELTWTEYEASLDMRRQWKAEGDDIGLLGWWKPKFTALAALRARTYPIVRVLVELLAGDDEVHIEAAARWDDGVALVDAWRSICSPPATFMALQRDVVPRWVLIDNGDALTQTS